MRSIGFPAEMVFNNYFDQEEHYLVKADELENNRKNKNQIALICNQPLVYENLFHTALGGALYKQSDAHEFLTWAHKGWNHRTHFVFFVLNKSRRIVGALDIKSADPNNAEIGYWADSKYSGNITNALKTLLVQASKTGFSKFTAFVLLENLPSSRVLMRTGFVEINNTERKGYLKYEKNL